MPGRRPEVLLVSLRSSQSPGTVELITCNAWKGFLRRVRFAHHVMMVSVMMMVVVRLLDTTYAMMPATVRVSGRGVVRRWAAPEKQNL